MPPSNPGQEHCHTLHRAAHFLDRHKPQISLNAWVLQTHPQLWQQNLPTGFMSPMCHSNCTSMGAFSFKFYFLGQTLRRLLFYQPIVLLGPAVVAQMWETQPEMLGQEWDPNWWHLLCHQDIPKALSSLTSLPSNPFHFPFAVCLQKCPKHNQVLWELEFKS